MPGPAGAAAVVQDVRARRPARAPGSPRAWLLLGRAGRRAAHAQPAGRRPAGPLAGAAHHRAGGGRRTGSASGDLAARADPGGPGELARVAGALNGLAGRIGELLREERETVADLAHRVRTPLTALRLDAEALPTRTTRARIGAGVDGCSGRHPGHRPRPAGRGREAPAGAGCDAAAVVARAGRVLVGARRGHRPAVDRRAAAPARCRSASAAADLDAAVDALLGNVFAHTPDGTRVRGAPCRAAARAAAPC